MKKLLWLSIIAVLAWVNFYPEPVKHYRPFTPEELQRIQKAQKEHGDYLIEIDGERWVMITSRGIIKL